MGSDIKEALDGLDQQNHAMCKFWIEVCKDFEDGDEAVEQAADMRKHFKANLQTVREWVERVSDAIPIDGRIIQEQKTEIGSLKTEIEQLRGEFEKLDVYARYLIDRAQERSANCLREVARAIVERPIGLAWLELQKFFSTYEMCSTLGDKKHKIEEIERLLQGIVCFSNLLPPEQEYKP